MPRLVHNASSRIINRDIDGTNTKGIMRCAGSATQNSARANRESCQVKTVRQLAMSMQ